MPQRPDPPNDLARYAGLFETTMRVRNLSEGTIRSTLWRLKRFLAFLGEREVTSVDRITGQMVRDYQLALHQALNSRGQPNTITYQNTLLSAALKFLQFLREEDHIVGDPGRGVAYAKAPKRLPASVLNPSEARKLLHAPDLSTVIGYRDRTILEVLYSTGMRKAELNRLTLGDVDYHDGFIRVVEGKGRKDRIVPVGRIACRYLENYIRSVRPELARDGAERRLFLTMRGGRFSKNVLWELIKKYAKRAKLKKNVHPHTFRHSCATAMLRNKADISIIQKLLGHASLDATQVYTHLSITDLKEVHSRCHPREKEKA